MNRVENFFFSFGILCSFLWYESFLYEYFGTTENNNLIVFINVYFLSTVIILQKIQFYYIFTIHIRLG